MAQSTKQSASMIGRAVLGRLGVAWRALLAAARERSFGAERRRLESRRLDRYQEMGRIVYQMYLEDRVRTKRLQGICNSVAEIEAAVQETDRRIAALRGSA